jgi:hypothetical protein
LSFKASISLGILGSVVAALSTSLRAKRSNPFFLYAAAWIAFARRAGQIFGDLPVVSIGRRPLHEVALARKANQFAARGVGKVKRAHHLSSNTS